MQLTFQPSNMSKKLISRKCLSYTFQIILKGMLKHKSISGQNHLHSDRNETNSPTTLHFRQKIPNL